MLHSHRSLQDLVDGELSDRRRVAVERHVARCGSCAATLGRLRGLKSSLLGLRNPEPHPELQRRLLAPGFASTAGSPAASGTGSEDEPDHTVTGAVFRHGSRSGPARRRRLVVVAGSSAAVATAILAGAYVVGGEQAPTAENLPGTTALRAGWDSVAPRTPAYLDAEQLETLRAGGWYCPELESLGFTLRSAEGITVAGRPTLELVLENGGDTVTVYEQRKVGGDRDPGGPLSAVTGNMVSSDGFEHIGGAGRDLWVRDGEPWQVVLDSPSVTYTVVADLPAAAMPQTLSQLVTTERAQLAFGPVEKDSTVERIIRGLATIANPGSAGG